ncbi:MAG: hypothetical protein M0R80_29730 [Proteobacteria bacterium]|jgi:hypothetical protein|nr:hypothetical protein [Pseudomonadota bacterium]
MAYRTVLCMALLAAWGPGAGCSDESPPVFDPGTDSDSDSDSDSDTDSDSRSPDLG